MPVNVTVGWLREFVPNDLTAGDLADRLASIGLAVDEIAPLGAEGGESADDARLLLDVTSNRGDCWSVLGVARELAASLGVKIKPPATELDPAGAPAYGAVEVRVEAPDLCPRYTARVVRGVRSGPSPEWMRRRLQAVGIRPISNVVDVTNYVLIEMGQPLHAFDMARLGGGRIVVRRARAGERLDLLDGTSRELADEDLVIAAGGRDGGRAVALAGIMGGADTEIGERTRDVLLESARFNQVSTRLTSKRHGVATESSVRFEHGVDPVGVELASRRAARLLAECAGGKVAPGVVDSNPDAWAAPEVELRHSRMTRLLGGEVPEPEARRILEALGLELVGESGSGRELATVWRVPSWRQDLAIEEDLIEEVARVYGYGRLPGRSAMRVFPVQPHPAFDARRRARDVLTGLGYTEVVGASFFEEAFASFGWTKESDGARSNKLWPQAAEPHVIRNPARAQENALRTSLVPSLLAARAANHNMGRRTVRLFEAGPVCLPGRDEPVERLALLEDRREEEKDSEDAFRRAKGAIEELACRLGDAELTFEAVGRPVSLSLLGQAAIVSLEGSPIGYLGEVNLWPGLKGHPVVAEIDLAAVASDRVPQAKPLPRYPGIVRDVSLLVRDEHNWARIAECAAAEDLKHEWRSPPAHLSTFRGKGVPGGSRAVAFRVAYRAADRTLTDEDVKGPHDEFVKGLCKMLGASVRQ